MSCCSSSGSSGGCCGGNRPFPWFSALTDPVIARMFLARYGRDLLAGLLAGASVSWAALAAGDALGGLGTLLRGSWMHFHAAAVIPTALLGAIVQLLGRAGDDLKGWLAPWGWVLALLALGGIGNGLLDLGDASGGLLAGFFQGGAWVSVPAFMALGLPAIALTTRATALAFRQKKAC